MHPGNVPQCLQGLSQIEEMLIAWACPIMTIYRKHGGQHGYGGHVVNLPQNIQGFLNGLPANVSKCLYFLFGDMGQMTLMLTLKHEDSTFLKHCNGYRLIIPATVTSALISLMSINFQKMVFLQNFLSLKNQIIMKILIPSQISEETNCSSCSFLPNPVREFTEECAIHS